MSKNSSVKFKAKQKKQAARNARREQKIENAINDAKIQITYYPGTLIEEKCAPDKDSVIFKGMTKEIVDLLNYNSSEITSFPLQDFYTEVKTKDGSILKLRWVPFECPIDRFAIYHYCRRNCQIFIEESSESLGKGIDHNAVLNEVFGFDKFSPDSFVATVYISYKDVYSMGYVMSDFKSKSIYLGMHHISYYQYKKTNPELFDKYYYAMDDIGKIILTIQKIVALYLNGEELPKLPISIDSSAKPRPKPNLDDTRHNNPTPRPEKPSEPSCVAYIRYDAIGGKVSISNSSREYSMKWWIVSGHPRHYKNGKVSKIPPYIKGDKDDPDAQRALEEFKKGFNRIKYYHLVARKPK